MSTKSHQAMADFCLACTSIPGIQALLATNPTVSDLVSVMKKLAFRQVTPFLVEEHHFMVTLLDTIDWESLAETVLANHLNESLESASVSAAIAA